MLKFYVETINRLGRSTHFIKEFTSAKKDENGFASAETIALAVAGVVIAGLALGFFSSRIEGWIENITTSIDGF